MTSPASGTIAEQGNDPARRADSVRAAVPAQSIGCAAAPQAGNLAPGALVASPGQLIALQRCAGNRAVRSWLGQTQSRSSAVRAVAPSTASPIAVQRDDPPASPAAPDQQTPAERVDAVTFPGFTRWAESATADADAAIADGGDVADALASPYSSRLNMLIGDVTGDANTLDWGLVALREGRPAPSLTADSVGFAHRFEDHLETLDDVTRAWRDVTSSAVMTLIGMIAEAQVARARALRQELADLLTELQNLERIAGGSDLRQAFAQLGINTAITGALLAISIANPIVGLTVAIGSAAVQCGLDELLGPSGNDAKDAVAVGIGIGGSAAEAAAAIPRLAKASKGLTAAGKKLGYVGAAAGTALDVLETQEAVAAYEAARSRIRTVSTRLERVARELEPLRPILAYPALAARLITRIQAQAATLRDNAQVVLGGRGQL